MTKLDIGQVLKDGWQFLGKYPTLILVAFLDVLFGEFLRIYNLWLVGFFWYLFAFFVMTQYTYEASRGNPSWKIALGALGPRLPILVLTTLIFFVAFFAGLLLLLIPGLILLVRWGCYDYVIMFEGAGVLDSFKRAWALTKGSSWRITAVMMILYLPGLLSECIPRTQFLLALNLFVQTFFQSWWVVTMLLVYFQLKKIKEGPAV